MKIGIVTVYESVSNIGSYLQAYALKTLLESWGHDVVFIEKSSICSVIKQHVFRLNPKRALFLRLINGYHFLRASGQFTFVPQSKAESAGIDCLIYGSDEIWNIENSYFSDPLFFGTGIRTIPMIAYAVSDGALTDETLADSASIVNGIFRFQRIMVRDEKTAAQFGKKLNRELPLVCDPTLLIDKSRLQTKARLPKEKYLLVYSYGLDQPMIENIKRFASEHRLKIISAHFWHPWCDKTVPCRPFEFGTLMAGAEYVFTTTFHGAIFAMLNHMKCAVLPVRSKVSDVVSRLGQSHRLIDENISYSDFSNVITQAFDTDTFECRLSEFRSYSETLLWEALQCLEK